MENRQPRTTHFTLASLLLGLSGSVIALQVFLLSGMEQSEHASGIAARRLPMQPHLASLLVASADVRMQPAALLGLRIEPDRPDGLLVMPSQTVRLTSVGIFSTMEQQVFANWSLLFGTTEQPIDGCTQSKSCAFTATAGQEWLSVIARSGRFQDTLPVRVLSAAANPFADALPDWAAAAIVQLHGANVIRGYEDGRFGPADTLLRGQGMTLIARVLAQTNLSGEEACNTVLQVPASHYAHDAVCLFVQHGWEPDQWVAPDGVLTRGETAAYLNRIFGPALLRAIGASQGAVLTAGQSFTDVPKDDWYFFDAGVMQLTGIMTGNPDGTFRTGDPLNRAEAAVIVDRLFQAIERWGIQRL